MYDIGLSQETRQEMFESLRHLFADSYAVYLKTQGFHWNVQGTSFRALHPWLEEQYKSLAEDVDNLAERLLQLGFHAPASFSELANLTQIKEQKDFSDSKKMLQLLMDDHALLIREARDIDNRASERGDDATCSLLDAFIQDHEKLLWMVGKMLA